MRQLAYNLVWLALVAGPAGLTARPGVAQVFTVGEATATADIKTDFKPTRVELPSQPMTERGRRELVRNFAEEQGFAHRVLPLGATLVLNANGTLAPGGEAYKKLLYKKGQSAAVGDRVVVTALAIHGNKVDVDLNGGPYPPHRILNHIQIGVGPALVNQPDTFARATGCRVELVFEGFVPEVSGPEMKALLYPVVDFGVKSGDLAYAETLPAPIKGAIDLHEVLVGMNHRMVLAAVGEPESKVRESNETDGAYEEWIYGHQPQTVKFVRFVGDRVTQVKVAAMGEPIVTRTADEMGGYQPEPKTHTVVVADGPMSAHSPQGERDAGSPSLKLPTEAKTPTETENGTSERKVQYPVPKQDPETSAPAVPPASIPGPATQGVPAAGPASAPPSLGGPLVGPPV